MKRLIVLGSFAAAIMGFAAEVSLVAPAENAVVPLITAGQKEYMDMPEAARREKMPDAEWRKELKAKTGYVPAKVKFAWKGGEEGAQYRIEIKRLPDGKVFYSGKTHKTELELDNFEIARTYEWSVKIGKKGEAAKGTFRTEDRAPRFVRLDGVPNMRDIGGRIGLGGKRVKQGMIYRSAGLNNNANKYYKPEEILKLHKEGKLMESVPEQSRAEAAKIKKHLDAGQQDKADLKHLAKKWCPGADRLNDKTREFAKEQFGIKTDLDLRTDRECYGMTGSPLGAWVKWEHIPSSNYGGMHGEHGKAAFAKCFRLFLDEANYPIDFHCIAGADHTGSLAYILNGLLGVSDAELALDWEITAFNNPNPRFDYKDRYDPMVAGFMKLPGATTAEKVANYVKSVGFTDADIAKFREIMLEK
jgi:protein-tyrosine phosphatase